MLKRIAVVGKLKSTCESLVKKRKLKDFDLVEAKPKKPLPPASVAVIGDEDSAGAVLDLALSAGRRQEELLELLAEAVDCREEIMAGSSLRVRDHASRFAKAMRLNAEDTLILERASLVRGVGKLKIPNKVLLKDSMLTYDEWSMLQQHTNIAADMLVKVDALKDVAEVVRRHHCSYDGTGYPDGLEGEKIPFLARALRIIDVYCAMTSPRHYREGQTSHKDALAHLRSEKGKHFDPDLVDVFIKSRVGRAK